MKTIQPTPRQLNILETWTRVSLATTDHIAALFFPTHGSPSKRASEHLKELEVMKLLEGYRGELSKPKVWRLAKRGRQLLLGETAKPPAPLTGFKVEHHLSITSCYVSLVQSGKCTKFVPELREKYGDNKIYAPDAFFVYDKKAYLLEVQRSPLSVERWAKKWAVASDFFDGNHHTKASFQYWAGKIIRPTIVVITSQPAENVQAGSRLPLSIRPKIIPTLEK